MKRRNTTQPNCIIQNIKVQYINMQNLQGASDACASPVRTCIEKLVLERLARNVLAVLCRMCPQQPIRILSHLLGRNLGFNGLWVQIFLDVFIEIRSDSCVHEQNRNVVSRMDVRSLDTSVRNIFQKGCDHFQDAFFCVGCLIALVQVPVYPPHLVVCDKNCNNRNCNTLLTVEKRTFDTALIG